MEKKRAGRPLKEDSKLMAFTLTLNQEKMDLFDALAIADDKTRSQRVRELIVDEIERREKG
jgi:hypothetical protein